MRKVSVILQQKQTKNKEGKTLSPSRSGFAPLEVYINNEINRVTLMFGMKCLVARR